MDLVQFSCGNVMVLCHHQGLGQQIPDVGGDVLVSFEMRVILPLFVACVAVVADMPLGIGIHPSLECFSWPLGRRNYPELSGAFHIGEEGDVGLHVSLVGLEVDQAFSVGICHDGLPSRAIFHSPLGSFLPNG